MARLLNCTDAEYFADPCPVPALSQSIAKTLLQKSPAHAWLEHPRLGGQQRKPTKAMDAGQLIHTLLLGKGQEVDILDVKDFKTKAAQEARDNAIASGMLLVKRADHDAALAAVEQIRANIAKFGITLDGASEIAIEWEESGERGPVLCRCRMDHVWLDDGRIIDVKKAESAHPKAAARAAINYGYHIQQAAYTRALAALKPEWSGRIRMLFLFMESEPPYAVLPAFASGQMAALGEAAWLRAVKLWERCLSANDWPSYARDPVALDAPNWMIDEMMMEGAKHE